RAPDLQRPSEHLRGAVVHNGGSGADRDVAARVVAGLVAAQARPGARGAVRGECIWDGRLRAVKGGRRRSKAGEVGCACSVASWVRPTIRRISSTVGRPGTSLHGGSG